MEKRSARESDAPLPGLCYSLRQLKDRESMAKAPHDRYCYKPFPGSSHRWALTHLAALPKEARVLDIGPGSGFTGRALKERGVEALFAVEIDEAARRHLSDIYRRVEADLEPFADSRFDAILLLDVLEHMTDPFEFFRRLVPLLEPGGSILVSVPNVAHWSVRIPLLFGRFEYRERGILDATHCQFFTRRRFIGLLRQPGLEVRELKASVSPVELLLPPAIATNPLFSRLSALRVGPAQLLPGLLGYQHLALLKKVGH